MAYHANQDNNQVDDKQLEDPGNLAIALTVVDTFLTWRLLLLIFTLSAFMLTLILGMALSPWFYLGAILILGWMISEVRLYFREKLTRSIRETIHADMAAGNEFTVTGGKAFAGVTAKQLALMQQAYSAGRRAEQQYQELGIEPRFPPLISSAPQSNTDFTIDNM